MSNTRDRWNLASLIEKQDSFGQDSPNFVNLFGGTKQRAGQFEKVFSDIEFDSDTERKPAPVTADSRVLKRKHPPPSKKRKSRKKKSVEDVDDSRPHSDRAAFDSLQNAKQLYRAKKHQGLTMAKTKITPRVRDNEVASDDDSPAKATRSKGAAKRPPPIPEESPLTELNKIPRKPKKHRGNNDADLSPGQENDGVNGHESSARSRDNHASGRETSAKDKDDMDDVDVDDFNEEMDRVLAEQRAKDKKIPKEKRLDVISDCRKTIYVLKFDLHNHVLKAKHTKKLEKEIRQLKDNQVKESLLAEKQAVVMSVNDEILKQCEEVVKTKLFKKTKFINSYEAESKAAEFVLNHIKLPQMTQGPMAKASAIKAYKRIIKTKLYLRKSYVTSEMKKMAFKMLKKEIQLPLPAMILKCATRSIDMNNEEEAKVFVWYWEELLPKMVGAKEWDHSVCYYVTISKAVVADEPKEQLITVSDEAMTVLLWDNCYERWLTLWAYVQNPANKGSKQPSLAGKYTETDKGQAQWGGWTNEGIQQFNTYFSAVKAARKAPNCKVVEEKCLGMIREKHNIVCATPEEQEKYNRSVKRAAKKGNTLQVGGVSVPMPALGSRTVMAMVDEDTEEEDNAEDSDDDDHGGSD